MIEVPADLLHGTLHIFVAFDWGNEVNLEHAGRLAPGALLTLARRPRTPVSVAFHPTPWRFRLGAVPVEIPELGRVEAEAEATVFDFGAVSVGLHLPIALSRSSISRLAGSLSDCASIVQAARTGVAGLYDKLLPSIEQPDWSPLSEEYFVFHFVPTTTASGESESPGKLLREGAAWTAGVVLLEVGALSDSEIAEALRLNLSYSPQDLFVPEWSAAVLVDRECEETLQMVEFANMQLLEYRLIDQRLDNRLARAYKLIHPLTRSWLPFWRMHGRQLRDLGELRIEMHDVFERTGNVLKLVGDQYLARCYKLLATRFHLAEWERNIGDALEVVQGTYQVLSDQSASLRIELLEAIVIFLIAFEILMAFLRQ
jgi:hypothetical protein